MRIRTIAGWVMATAMTITAISALGQEEGPILLPKPKPVARPASPTLLVICDLACNWKLDGEAKGHIVAGGSAKANVVLGQHMVVAVTEDGVDQVKLLNEVKTTGQTIVNIELKPVRDARLKAEQEAKDKAAQEARDKAEREEKEKADREAKEKAARDEAARLQDLHDHAGERFSQGKTLYDQKRYEEARPLLQKACDGGELRGCANLGLLYSHGQGVSQDYAQARTLYQKACNGGALAGCAYLGTLYYKGNGVIQDYAQARTLFQKACDGGEMRGCYNLGVSYYEGKGVSQDYAQARMLSQKACDGGIMAGCDNLGILYKNGQGIARDSVQARTLFQKACDGGDEQACTNLRNLQ